MEIMTTPQIGWGPDSKRSALSFTFDNLGEAADLEFGKWPANVPVGRHYTVTEVLPALMERLVAGKVTFFVEAWNAQTYPEILQQLDSLGHDVALHGWRHELWGDMEPQRQREIIKQSLDAFAKIGLQPCGFRPPGGTVAENPSGVLREFGFTYYSASDRNRGILAGVAQIPFAWEHLDGVYLMPGGAAMAGLSSLPEAASLDGMRRAFHDAIRESIDKGRHLTLVFHPWLLGQDRERLEVLVELYDYATHHPELWVAPCRDVARWVLRGSPKHPALALG
jgi:peptidoglycan/xylan/chitin deacetylase (PgdA/CDA1 family)